MSSDKRPWYKWYPKDFRTDDKVQCLSPMAELVYRRILDVMWQNSACVLLNDCLKLANAAGGGLSREEFEKCWSEIQTEGFEIFKTTEDKRWIYSKRLSEQLQELENKKKAGSIGGKKRASRQSSRIQAKSKQNPSTCQAILDTDTDINNTPLPPKGGNEYSESFEKFWKVYPKKVGKDAAYRSWKKIGKSGESSPKSIISAIETQVSKDHFVGTDGNNYFPNPSTWLNQGRWKDEIKNNAGQQQDESRPQYTIRTTEEELNELYE